MAAFDTLVPDPALRRLLRAHLDTRNDLDLETAARVQQVLPQDGFSASQYLLGLPYFRRRLDAVFPDGNTLLDLGCGAGNWSLAAAQRFKEVIGVDARADRVAAARAMAAHVGASQARFLEYSKNALPLPDASVDHILCYNALQCVHESHAALMREARRVIKPGGLLYVWTTDVGWLIYVLRQTYETGTLERWKDFVRSTVMNNLLFAIGLRDQPLSWIGPRYLARLASRTGWDVLGSGPEAVLGTGKSLPIYPHRFAGFPFGREYLLKARG